MRTTTFTATLALSVLLIGCGKKAALPSSTQPTTTATPGAQPAITAWQQGDKAAAVHSFVDADWSTRPLFASGSVLNLSEDQFKALSNDERKAKASEMTLQLDALKKLAAAVADSARDAASKGDNAQARKYFTALKQCGSALDSPDCLSLVQLVGKAFKKMADAELAKIPQ